MNVCLDCQLGKILEGGVPSVAIQSSHAMCAGSPESPCLCGCDFALRKRCRLCYRPRQTLAPSGTCADHESCARETAKQLADEYRARQERLAADPKRKTKPVKTEGAAATRSDCLCGCGETCGGYYRPGHDSRHLSALVAQVKAGGMTEGQASEQISHSAALVAKLQKRLR